MSSRFRSSRGSFRVKGSHFTRIQQTLGVIALLGQELDVVGAITAAAFHIVHVRIGDEHADFVAEVDHFIQARLR